MRSVSRAIWIAYVSAPPPTHTQAIPHYSKQPRTKDLSAGCCPPVARMSGAMRAHQLAEAAAWELHDSACVRYGRLPLALYRKLEVVHELPHFLVARPQVPPRHV